MVLNVNLTLRDIIDSNARWYSDRKAFICGDKSVTHGEFLDQSNRIASALHKLGLSRQDRVSILSTNSVEYTLVYGACETHGLIAATVNFRLAPPETLGIINDSTSRVLIFEDEYTNHVEQIKDKLETIEHFVAIGKAPDWAMSWDEFVASGDPAGPPFPKPIPEDIVYLIYTSGSTGKPKGVMLTQASEVALAQLQSPALQMGVQDRTLLMMPLFHIGAKSVSLGAQLVGGTVYLHKVFDPVAILSTIEKEQITITHMAPTMIQQMVETPDVDGYNVSSLKSLLYSAAAMPPPLLKRALETFGQIFQQMYGQTEGVGTLLPVTAHEVTDDEKIQKQLTSVGHPILGVECQVRNDNEEVLGPNEIGEICMKGPANMLGYWNNSAATVEALRDGWLHTGDVGYVDEDEYVYLVDRKKDVIISGGENIYSREVENAILEHNAVSTTSVIGLPDEKWGEKVVAIVVLRPDASLTEEDLIAHCRTLIAGYKCPKQTIFTDELPLLASGKINKPAIRAKYLEEGI